MIPNRVLNAWVRAFTALARVTRKVRMTSTIPALAFGVAVAVPLSTERAICSASRRSDLPSWRRAARSGRLTSTTRMPAAASARVSVAPKDPVLSIPIAATVPCERNQSNSAPYPWSLAGNSRCPSSRPWESIAAA